MSSISAKIELGNPGVTSIPKWSQLISSQLKAEIQRLDTEGPQQTMGFQRPLSGLKEGGDLLVLPGGVVPEHGIETGEQLTHTGDHRDFSQLASCH